MRPEMVSDPHRLGPLRALAAGALFLVMLLIALALWTAVPLGWIWVGSQLADTQFFAAGPYAVVAIGILVTIVVGGWAINRLNALYVRVTGSNRLAPTRAGWLRSMREDQHFAEDTTVVEAVLVCSVLLAGAVFLAWFLLLAGSPIPNQ